MKKATVRKVAIATCSIGIGLLITAAITFFFSPLYILTGSLFVAGVVLVITTLFLTLWS